MNVKPEISKQIVRYTLLLMIFYALTLITNYSLKIFIDKPADNVERLIKSFIPWLLVIVENSIAVFLVVNDIRKFGVRNKYLPWLTFFFCPVGICVLLIHLIAEDRAKIETK